jgi:hypothetical protein
MFILTAKKKKIESIENQIQVIADVKDFLKKDKIVKDMFKEYGRDIEELDGVSISFHSKIDSTAKTVNGKMYLNSSLLDEKFEVICRYVVHELTHVFQHIEKEFKKDDGKRREKYLERPEEIEAFQNQIKFDAKETSKKEVEEYVNGLLRYHKVKDKNEFINKKRELLKKLK